MKSLYINEKTLEYPITPAQVRKENSNVSFPATPSDEVIATMGYSRVHETPPPKGKIVEEGPPVKSSDGVWKQTWVEKVLTTKEHEIELERAKEAKKREITSAYGEQIDSLLSDYLLVEIMSWPKQEAEARAWLQDNTVKTPFLNNLSNTRNLPLSELVPRVVAKADRWMTVSGSLTGNRQRLEDLVDKATTIDEVEAIKWGS